MTAGLAGNPQQPYTRGRPAAAVLHLALSTLPEPQQRALTAAVPAIDALARAIDRLADTPPADQDPR